MEEKKGSEKPAFMIASVNVVEPDKMGPYMEAAGPLSIFKITLKGGNVEILTMETMSALPIEDKVAMAMVVIPRTGVKFIQTGNEKIPVANNN